MEGVEKNGPARLTRQVWSGRYYDGFRNRLEDGHLLPCGVWLRDGVFGIGDGKGEAMSNGCRSDARLAATKRLFG